VIREHSREHFVNINKYLAIFLTKKIELKMTSLKFVHAFTPLARERVNTLRFP
jgi:hypothetical protein